MRIWITIAAALLLCNGALARQTPPNIIFILADDLGYGDVGVYGQSRIATPNIDRLAAEGIRFTQAYAGSPVCAPSRATLMTGKHTGHARVRSNFGRNGRVPLQPDDVTVAEVLKLAGYRTAAIGKWGLGEAGTRGVPNDQGFDEWFGFLNQDHALHYYPTVLWDNRGQIFPDGNQGAKQEEYVQDLFTTRALRFISQNASQPFFLYLAYTVPHADSERSRHTGDGYVVPDYGPYASRDWPQPDKGYAAMVHRLDADVGKIIDQVKALGIESQTLVVFTSDNGPAREGQHAPAFFQSSGPLRGMKGTLYEGGIRVPFIARWPGHIQPGGVSDQLVAFWDMLPTAAELAGVAAPRDLDGVSILPALLNQSQPAAREYLYWELTGRSTAQAVRLEEWKGIRTAPGAPVQLYRLTDDMQEERDRAAERPEIVRRIEAIMKSARTDSPDFPMRH